MLSGLGMGAFLVVFIGLGIAWLLNSHAAGSTYDAAILNDHPIAYWAMSNTATGTEPDLTGNGHAGTYKGGTPALGSMLNGDQAATFNGSSEYLTIPSATTLSIPTTKQLTWEAWIRPDTLQFPHLDSTGEYVDFMGKCQNYSPSCEWESRMYATTNSQNRPNRISAYAFNPSAGLGSAADWQPDTGLVQAGQWLHVVGEYRTDATPNSNCNTAYPGTLDIWVNGVKWNQSYHGTTGCMSQYNIVPQAGSSPLNIGTMALDSWFQGAIGKVAIYNYLLSQAQISAHFQAMTGAAPSGSCANTCTIPQPTQTGTPAPTTIPALTGDINKDGTVNVFDLSTLLSDWGTANATADLNSDGTVNIFDLSLLLSHWGQTGATPTPTPTPSPTPGQATNCAASPHVCGYPDASNTGVPAGVTLTKVPGQITSGNGWHWDPRGWMVIDGTGAVLDSLEIDGSIDVYAPNVTIKRSKIIDGDQPMIRNWQIGAGGALDDIGAGLVMTDDDFDGAGNVDSAAMAFDSYTILRGNFHNIGAAVKLGNNVDIEDSYVHDIAGDAASHNSGFPSDGGDTITLKHNTVMMQVQSGYPIALYNGEVTTETVVVKNVTVDNNLLAGGNYVMYCGAPGKISPNLKVTNNRFSKILFPNGGYYGSTANCNGAAAWTNNYWDDNLSAVTP